MTTSQTTRFDEPIEEYHQDDGYLSKSRLSDFLSDPSSFKKEREQVESSSLTLGSAVHLYFEHGTTDIFQKIPGEYSTQSGWSKHASSRAFLEEQDPGINWISKNNLSIIEKIASQVEANSAVKSLVGEIESHEVSIRWKRKDGFKLKCRPDAITRDGVIVDWKTTRHVNPLKEFWKSVLDFRYHLQDALYREGAAAAGYSGEPLKFVAISTIGSCPVHVVTLPRHASQAGKRLLEEAIEGIQSIEAFGGEYLPNGYGEEHELFMPNHLFKE